MNKHLKHLLLWSILSLPVTISYCGAMEQSTTPEDAFQQKMNLAVHTYFKHLAETKANEGFLRAVQPFRQFWIDQDPTFGNTISSIRQKINVRDTISGKGWTLLHFAVHHGEKALVKLLLSEGALIIPSLDGQFPDQVGKFSGTDEGLYRDTSEYIVNIKTHGHDVLEKLKWPDDFDILKNPNARLPLAIGWTPLHVAMRMGDLSLVKYLLANGAFILGDNLGEKPSQCVLMPSYLQNKADYEEAKRLIDAIPDRGQMVSNYDWQGADLLTDPNCRDANHNGTPLHAAAYHNDLPFVRFLLKNGAKFLEDKHGKYPHEQDLLDNSTSKNAKKRCKQLLQEAFLESLRAEDGTIDTAHLKRVWSLPLKYETAKFKGPLTDDALYDLMDYPKQIGLVRFGEYTGLSPIAQQIANIFFDSYFCGRIRLGKKNIKMTEKDLAALARAITRSRLYSLELHDNPGILGPMEVRRIMQAVLPNTNMKHLNTGKCGLGNEEIKELSDMLAKKDNLNWLGLSDNRIEDTGVTYLCQALSSNPKLGLESLYLSSNPFGDTGATEIAKVIATSTTLKRIDLEYNNIGEIGLKAIAEALTTNTKLEELYLNVKELMSDGLSEFYKVIRRNKALTKLKLCSRKSESKCYIPSASVLHAELRNNTTLKTLIIGSPGIGEEWVKFFVGFLKDNTTLTKLTFYNCKLSSAYREEIKEKKVNGICEITFA